VVDAAALAGLLSPAEPGRDGEGAVGLDLAVGKWLAAERPHAGAVYDIALAAFERPLFAAVLEQTGGNQLRAAEVLGINRNTLRKRLTELEIDPAAYLRRP
jgi:two-component system, NtrC family, nitrogen regulation response regulator GlnG